MKFRVAPPLLALAILGIGCSSPAPSGGSSSDAQAEGDGGPAMLDDADERCRSEAYASGECDLCQNQNCCKERFGCYDDKSCYWADWVFDKCSDGTSSDAGGDAWDTGSGDAGSCWDQFENGSGSVGKALYDCIQRSCRTECKVP